MKLIFEGYNSPKPRVYKWKAEIPWEFKHEIEEELIKLYGKDVKYSMPVYAEAEVYINQDSTNLTMDEVLKLHDNNPPFEDELLNKPIDIL